MTSRAWIGNFIFVRHGWRDEPERMRMNIRARDPFAFNLWHMAGNALAPRTAVFVMGVFFERGRARAIRRRRAMTLQADLVRRLDELRAVRCAMYIVAGGTANSVPIHDALHKVVALHAVFVGRAVW